MENLLGEFCGVVVLVVFGVGVCANLTLTKSKGVGGGWICISAGWGFAVLLGVFTASALGAPQADINPAVTLAKTFVGVYTAGQAIATMIAQMAGGVVGGAVGHNEISILIPCHRVVGTNGSLTGYAGGIDKKIQLLKLEKADMSHFFIPKKGTAL